MAGQGTMMMSTTSTHSAVEVAAFPPIRVNSQWRLVFRWDGSRGEAEGVYLDDHSYR